MEGAERLWQDGMVARGRGRAECGGSKDLPPLSQPRAFICVPADGMHYHSRRAEVSCPGKGGQEAGKLHS